MATTFFLQGKLQLQGAFQSTDSSTLALTMNVLVVGGGSGGFGDYSDSTGGGGGAGGIVISSVYSALLANSYSVIVGAGGSAGHYVASGAGTASTCFNITASGGFSAGVGLSDGGASNALYAGGSSVTDSYANSYGGGGAGAGGAGGNASALVSGYGTPGIGGGGIVSAITGSAVTYGSGGSGATYGDAGIAGSQYGGGGAAGCSSTRLETAGNSGVVMLSYASPTSRITINSGSTNVVQGSYSASGTTMQVAIFKGSANITVS